LSNEPKRIADDDPILMIPTSELSTAMLGKKTALNYLSNTFLKPRSILKSFGTRIL